MKKFLIVDDDTDDRDLFREALEEVTPDSVCYNAPNGLRALLALENGEIEVPDIIFLDINMPVMNGWQLLAKLKESQVYKMIPVIMYSTSSFQEDIEKAQQLGALCFLTKPSNFKKLKSILALVADHMYNGSLNSLGQHLPLLVRSVLANKMENEQS